MVEAINFVVGKVKELNPNFNLTGKLLAEGEVQSDVWLATIVDALGYDFDYIYSEGSEIDVKQPWEIVPYNKFTTTMFCAVDSK